MPVRATSIPAGSLYRIGRAPDPMADPPPSIRQGAGRFDDPEGRINVRYAGERRACFVETLARFRLPLDLLAALAAVQPGDRGRDLPPLGTVPSGWLTTRRIAVFTVDAPDRSWLDLREPETHQALRRKLAIELRDQGYEAYALGDALGQDRRLTQLIARWARDQGHAGIIYLSRYDPHLTCTAIFPDTRLVTAKIEPIAANDPDLLAAAALFELAIEPVNSS
jgi:hypothetical protein